jgi:MFS transporter, DHA2 family, multidrug resistance protein
LATESVSGAYGVAERLGAAGAPLIDAADSAFVAAMHWAAAGSAFTAAIAVLVVLRWLPGRTPAGPPHGPESEPNAGQTGEPQLARAS